MWRMHHFLSSLRRQTATRPQPAFALHAFYTHIQNAWARDLVLPSLCSSCTPPHMRALQFKHTLRA